MPKKILFIGHSSELYGGAEDDFERILKYFHSIPGGNYEIHGLFPKGEHSRIYEKYCSKFAYIDKIFLPVISHRKKDYLYFIFYSLKQILDIRRFIKNEKYDLCVLNVAVQVVPAIYLHFKGYKLVVFIREMIFPFFIRKRVYLMYSKKAAFVIAVTHELEREYKEITKKNNITTLFSAIEENPQILNSDINLSEIVGYEIMNHISSSNAFKFICIGHISARKNQKLIVGALALLKKQGNTNLPEIYLIGRTDDDIGYFNEINELIKKEKLNKYFFFLEGQPKNVLYKILTLINVIIISSVTEGLPIVIATGLKFKIPIISTKAGGITDIIENDYNGLLTDMNPESLAKNIIKIMNDSDLRSKIIQNGYNTYKEKLNLEKNLLMIKDVFDSVIEE